MNLPERDEDRRKIFYLMLHLSKTAGKHFTVEELETICLHRGYLKVEASRGSQKEAKKK